MALAAHFCFCWLCEVVFPLITGVHFQAHITSFDHHQPLLMSKKLHFWCANSMYTFSASVHWCSSSLSPVFATVVKNSLNSENFSTCCSMLWNRKCESMLIMQHFSIMVNCICPSRLNLFLTSWLRYFTCYAQLIKKTRSILLASPHAFLNCNVSRSSHIQIKEVIKDWQKLNISNGDKSWFQHLLCVKDLTFCNSDCLSEKYHWKLKYWIFWSSKYVQYFHCLIKSEG